MARHESKFRTEAEERDAASWSAHNFHTDPDDGSAFRKLREERESFGNPPPSADFAGDPLTEQEGKGTSWGGDA